VDCGPAWFQGPCPVHNCTFQCTFYSTQRVRSRRTVLQTAVESSIIRPCFLCDWFYFSFFTMPREYFIHSVTNTVHLAVRFLRFFHIYNSAILGVLRFTRSTPTPLIGYQYDIQYVTNGSTFFHSTFSLPIG